MRKKLSFNTIPAYFFALLILFTDIFTSSSHTETYATIMDSPATIVKSTINSAANSTATVIPATFLEKHSMLNEMSHYLGEVIGPHSYHPSSRTQKDASGEIPVILVHGTWANANWINDIYDALDKAGIPTYARTFGTGDFSLAGLIPFIGGVAPLAKSERELSHFIEKIQKETGAPKVDLVGHSQGGLLIKDYIAHDHKDNVQAVVELGATNHGTTDGGESSLIYFFPHPIQTVLVQAVSLIIGHGATDQLPRSPTILNLDKYPDTKAGIHYLVLSDRDDTTSTPYMNTYLRAVPGADVTDQEIHSLPGVTGKITHSEMPLNPGVIHAILLFIEHKGEPVPSIGAISK